MQYSNTLTNVHIVDLFEIDGGQVDVKELQIHHVRENTKIIKRATNWSLAIKEHKPELNTGVRSCKDLALF